MNDEQFELPQIESESKVEEKYVHSNLLLCMLNIMC